VKRKSLSAESEAGVWSQGTQSPMLLLPPDITCDLTPEEETALARQIAEYGDESATKRLYCCCLAVVYYYFLSKTRGNRSETEYLTQETLIRAVQGLRNGTWAGEEFRHWLFGIRRIVFLEWWRGTHRWPTIAGRNESRPEDEMEQLEQVDLLDAVLIREQGTTLWGVVRELPEQDRLVLGLRYIHGLHYAEMAKLLKCTEHACRTQHWRALNRLRELIKQAGLGEELGFGKGKQQI
jgi:RNA polymerase sigma factor (sigma-70 family)